MRDSARVPILAEQVMVTTARVDTLRNTVVRCVAQWRDASTALRRDTLCGAAAGLARCTEVPGACCAALAARDTARGA